MMSDEAVIAVEQAGNNLRCGQAIRICLDSVIAKTVDHNIIISAAETATAANQSNILLAYNNQLPETAGIVTANGKRVINPQSATQHAALLLLRKMQLLPVAFVLPNNSDIHVAAEVNVDAIDKYEQYLAASIYEVANAILPTKYSENCEVRVFRSRFGGAEHLALQIGDIATAHAPLVRLHSACLTGDLLGSMRCDCGGQLEQAMQLISAEQAGILCYLNQEGRGIGIANKIRAYALQDQGQDTIQANESLGFAADERHFHIAAAILTKLGISKIRLLTNNPSKVKAMEQMGITIAERVPLAIEACNHNASYLNTKASKFGHWL